MTHETKETWKQRISRWEQSGLSAQQFAAEMGLNRGTLSYWRSRLRREARERRETKSVPRSPRAQVPFVEIGGASVRDAERIELVVDDRFSIRVPAGSDAATLRAVIDAVTAAR